MKIDEYYRISTDECGGYVEFTQKNGVNALSLTGLKILEPNEIVKLQEFLDELKTKHLI